MPPGGWARASTAKFSGEPGPELQDPSPHRFVGDIQIALRKQIFDVAIAERETHIQPNGVPHEVLCVKFSNRRSWLGLGSCGLAEVGFLVFPEIVHIEVAVGFEPVFVCLDG